MATAYALQPSSSSGCADVDEKSQRLGNPGIPTVTPPQTEDTDMGMHTEITAAGPALAAVETAIVDQPTAQQTFEAADAVDRPRRTDEEVIAWLGARNIIPPFTADFLDEIRSQMDGLEWVRKVSEIRKDPERMVELVAKYREAGLGDIADGLEKLRLEDFAAAAGAQSKPVEEPELAPAAAGARLSDAALLDAWVRRQSALAAIEQRGSYYDGETREPEASAEYDEAEALVAEAPAFTLSGVLAKLWVAMSHGRSDDGTEDGSLYEHCRRADIEALDPLKADLNYERQVLFSAIKALSALTSLPATEHTRWKAALEQYEALQPRIRTKGLTDQEVIDLTDQETKAGQALLDTPAPTFGAILTKLKVASALEHMIMPETIQGIIADAERLRAPRLTPMEEAAERLGKVWAEFERLDQLEFCSRDLGMHISDTVKRAARDASIRVDAARLDLTRLMPEKLSDLLPLAAVASELVGEMAKADNAHSDAANAALALNAIVAFLGERPEGVDLIQLPSSLQSIVDLEIAAASARNGELPEAARA